MLASLPRSGTIQRQMSNPASQHETRMVESANLSEVPDGPELHDLIPFVAGEKIFAVFADHVDGTAEARVPAALPNAPPAVLGVVCVRGRMLTVIDPIAVLGGETFGWPASLPSVIALRGDEQLALAAQSCRDTITIAAGDIQPLAQTNDGLETAALGITIHGGEEIIVLRVDNLFVAAVRRKERRRRRF
jgi:purine-binding chemotaxis protein CheW